MVQTTTIRIVSHGTPVAGVQVVASDLDDKWRTTDENGEITAQFDDDQVLCSLVAVKLSSGNIYTAHLILEAGDTEEIAVPSA